MRLASLFLLIALPSCSLVFDGSAYRPSPDGDAAAACTILSCGLGARCDTITGMCTTGCDEDDDCPDLELCDLALHVCEGDTGCLEDTDCAANEYCDELGACTSCDADSDGWAPVDASMRCVGGMVVGLGDCAPGDPAMHPLALPDCMRSSNETCQSTGAADLAGLLAPNGFEVGATALTDLTAGELLPGTLRVYVLGATMLETTVLVLAQRADGSHAPVFQVVPLRETDLPGAPLLAPLATWDTTGVAESFVASMSLGIDGVEIVVVERMSDGTGRYRFLHVDRSGSMAPRAPQVLDLGGMNLDAVKSVLMGRNGGDPVALLSVEVGGVARALIIEAAAQSTLAAEGFGPGVALDGRSFAALPDATGVAVWNGARTPVVGRTTIAASARYGFASSPLGHTLSIGIDGSVVRTVSGTCALADSALGTCLSSAAGTIGLGMDVANEPLVTLDWTSGDVFGVAARLPAGAGILLTLVNTPTVAPHGRGALVFPVPTLTRPFVTMATDADLGIATATSGAAARIAAAYGLASGDTVRLMAVHLCVDALP